MAIELTYHERRAIKAIPTWLIADNTARRGARNNFYEQVGYANAQSFYNTKLPNTWKEIQRLRGWIDEETSKDALLKYRIDVGRTALRACEDTRRMYIHMKITKKGPLKDEKAKADFLQEVEGQSWAGLHRYTNEVLQGVRSLPRAELLDEPIEDAINGYWGANVYKRQDLTYIGMVGLAAVILSQQVRGESLTSRLVWIEPGARDDEYNQWPRV